MTKKINQQNRPELPKNAFIGPSMQVIESVNHDMQDADQAIRSNAAILKKSVKQARLHQFAALKNGAISELKDIPHDIVEVKKWNEIKEGTMNTFENIGTKTVHELKDANQNLSKVSKSALEKSTNMMSSSKSFLSENTPKVTKSFKSIFKRRQSFNQKDLSLLEKLYQLKESGVLTQKEFDAKKKKILVKI